MRVVIADDEPLGRYTLRSMIVELQVPEDAIIEVGDGVELTETVERVTPDVAFVDIKMPKLNGLDAIGRLVNDCF
jgi:two-component system, response regulator YesN